MRDGFSPWGMQHPDHPPHPDPTVLCRPQWTITGGPLPNGGVLILASDRLNDGRLEHEFRNLYPVSLFDHTNRTGHMKQVITLHLEMDGYHMFLGETYEDAMRAMFEQWRPPEPERAAPLALGSAEMPSAAR